ncbi:MAG: chemotaxis protein CheA [Clostridiales Family XIII bacterium]|jgi:two-component system chemotaxis sensor kinase CheA|nr:chemotaxis protein CheA [Clostridiales Family XIII bacterium]
MDNGFSNDFNNDSLLELYLFEAGSLLDGLDGILLEAERSRSLNPDDVGEIFRIMHTIKGSSAMMSFDTISTVAHRTEDVFSAVRDSGIGDADFEEILDAALMSSEFIAGEVAKMQDGAELSEGAPELIAKLEACAKSIGNMAKPENRATPYGNKDAAGWNGDYDKIADMPRAPEGGRILGIEPPSGAADTDAADNAAAEATAAETETARSFYDDIPAPKYISLSAPEPAPEYISPFTPEPVYISSAADEPVPDNTPAPAPEPVPENISAPALEPAPENISAPAPEPVPENIAAFAPVPVPIPAPSAAPPISGGASGAAPTMSTVFLHIHFNDGARMENIRAFMLANKLSEFGTVDRTVPAQLESNATATDYIVENGFYISFTSNMFREQVGALAKGTLSVESVSFVRKMPDSETSESAKSADQPRPRAIPVAKPAPAPAMLANMESMPSRMLKPISAPAQTQEKTQEQEPAPAQVPLQEQTYAPAPPAEPITVQAQEPAKAHDTTTPAEPITVPPSVPSGKPPNAHIQRPPDEELSRATHTLNAPAKQNLINVDAAKLDTLLDLVGEIVINESMLTEHAGISADEPHSQDSFNKAAHRLGKLTDELHDSVMSVRMVPVRATFQRMRRGVRDISRQLGKDVELVIVGESTEVDKTILDAIGDPIMHLVRNALDHAIELPDERVQAGKSRTGHITLSAQNVGSDVIISVSDDGRGINRDKILARAEGKGMLKKPADEYSSREVAELLMEPGFSTNDEVTEYSGRGVGLDVVKMNIEQLGGMVIIESAYGVGTNVLLKIPLTLAIIDCMELRIGGEVFAIPVANIIESFRSDAGQLVTDPTGREMIVLRGVAYTIVRLHEKLNIGNAVDDFNEGILILVDAAGNKSCLFADEVIGTFQIVVKGIPKYLNQWGVKNSGISGCTITGSGDVSLILDAQRLIS